MISAPLSWGSSPAELMEVSEAILTDANIISHTSLALKLQRHRALGSPLVNIDLHPVERNFFLGISGEEQTRTIIQQYYQELQSHGKAKAAQWLMSQLSSLPDYQALPKSSRNKTTLVEADPKRLRFFKSRQYDYYQELIVQYQQLKQEKPEWSKWIYTIQGLHALGVGYPEAGQFQEEFSLNASHAQIKSRIRQLKGEEPLEGSNDYWQQPPFAIALASHFHNTYCGQASSLPEALRLLYDQRGGKDLGFLQEATYDIIHELLGIDRDLQLTGSRRILIDVRHMSPAARKTYYQHVIARYNENPSNHERKIPIIATHVGFSGIDSLDELIRHASEGKENDNFRTQGFLSWGYNLSDEDVIAIFNSHGLINIANDKRLLGEEHHWTTQIGLKAIVKRRGKQLVKRTIEQFVRIPFDYFLTNPLKVWDIISFHPAISPSESTATEEALAWETIEEDLLVILHQLKREEPILFGNYRPEDLVKKICHDNLDRILKDA